MTSKSLKAARTRLPNAAKPPASRQPAGAPKKAKATRPAPETYHLRLYVAGQTRKSLQAVANLKEICETHLAGRYTIEVIDLMQQPQLARADQILAIPTLVRKMPSPIRKIIGDLSNRERVLVGLDVLPDATQASR